MTDPSTDCPPCPWCCRHLGCPQMADEAGHRWDGRHRTYDPRALWCPCCGAEWIEGDLDRVAQAWRAQAAYEAKQSSAQPGIVREGNSRLREASGRD